MTNDEKNALIAKFMGYTIERRHFQYKSYNSSNEYYWANDEDDVVVLDDMIVENYDGEPVMCFEELAFHEWNTLMPVVGKIELMDMDKYEHGLLSYLVDINRIHVCISKIGDEGIPPFIQIVINKELPKLEAVYQAVVEFIEWHNKLKLSKDE